MLSDNFGMIYVELLHLQQYGNSILTRVLGMANSSPNAHPFTPTLYVKSNEPSDLLPLMDNTLNQFSLVTMAIVKNSLKPIPKIENYPIYGQTDLTYQYISSMYPNNIEFDMSKMRIFSIDIETTGEHGFPDTENPIEEVLLITVVDNQTKEIFTWGSGECFLKETKDLPVTYTYCADEYDLLEKFMSWWANDYPDVITGWNLELFDMPYLVGRIDRIFSDSQKFFESLQYDAERKLFAVTTKNYSRLISRVSSNLITWTCTKVFTRSRILSTRLYC